MRPEISLIIPVFNNADTLPVILDILRKGREKIKHEIIVVDNGSTDGSFEFISKLNDQNYIRAYSESKRGAGAARNFGALKARFPVLLFLGGDIIPDENLLETHWHIHKCLDKDNYGCLGNVTWDPSLPPSPFMIFLEHGGQQNAYDEIAGLDFVDPAKYFYGSNVSLKRRKFVETGGFDDKTFSGYGWEDLELGIRLKEMGFKLFYEPQAKGLHRHKVSFETAKKRMYQVGKSYVLLQEKHPEQASLDLKKEEKKYVLRSIFYPDIVQEILCFFTRYFEERKNCRWLFQRVLSLVFYKGVHEAYLEKEKNVDNTL